MKKRIQIKRVLSFLFVTLIFLLPLIGLSEYVMRVIVICGLYIMLAASLNLLSGVTGQVSVGHIAFYGIGAYTSALAAMRLSLPYIVCFLLAIVVSAIMGLVIGLPSLRLTGAYLAVITLGFGEVVRIIMLNWMELTRGPMGLVNVPAPELFGISFDNSKKYFYLIFFSCIVTLLFLRNIIGGKYGRNLFAIKYDEMAAASMGINVYKNKVIAFVISAAIAGAAGSLYAHLMMFLDPSSFVGDESIVVLSMVVLGGMGNMWGAVAAAVLLTALPELLRSFAVYRMLVYGILLVTIMLLKCVNWHEHRFVIALKKLIRRIRDRRLTWNS